MTDERFGAHIKRLREVRSLTQDDLAQRRGLAADTIRRLEHQEFSPSLRTLRKVCKGLGISVPTLFNSFELSKSDGISRIAALLAGRSDLDVVERLLITLLTSLDKYRDRG